MTFKTLSWHRPTKNKENTDLGPTAPGNEFCCQQEPLETEFVPQSTLSKASKQEFRSIKTLTSALCDPEQVTYPLRSEPLTSRTGRQCREGRWMSKLLGL